MTFNNHVTKSDCKYILFIISTICFIRAKQNKAYLLQVGSDKIPVFCHMTSLGSCGGSGWTLVMKMNGSQVYASFILLSFHLLLQYISIM